MIRIRSADRVHRETKYVYTTTANRAIKKEGGDNNNIYGK